MNNEEQLKEIIAEAFKKAGYPLNISDIQIEKSKDPLHGDYACAACLKLARTFKKAPRDLANAVLPNLEGSIIDKVEVAGPGFLNFFLKKEALSDIVNKIIEEDEHFGDGEDKHFSYNIEYVSANPTGDLHLGHTRGAALGDSIANILKKAGYGVTREYYVNDCGNQIRHLGLSIRARYHELFGEPLVLGEDDYHGVDLIEIAKEIKEKYGDKYLVDNDESKTFFEQYGREKELAKIKKDLADFGVKFDIFSYESDIRKGDTIKNTIQELRDKGFVYEQDGATYLKTTGFLDDKDRPIIKKDGSYTYFMPDICYHYLKKSRGYDVLIDMLGADHHGYINRMKSAMMMKGYPEDSLNIVIYQIVRVFKDGEEVRMSKRTGKAITHRELVEEVGVDAVRYYFATKAPGLHLDFDINLAVSKSKDNPVYYVEYAHARIASLLKLGEEFNLPFDGKLLTSEEETTILKKLAAFPSVVSGTAQSLNPSKIGNYLEELAQLIHEYYAKVKILDRDNQALSSARLQLLKASKIVIKEGLRLLGVKSYDKM